jgi:uncharacterized protein YdhG (YjbR/CyaY superfamily)
MKGPQAKNIDEYVTLFPVDVRKKLVAIRSAIQSTAPQAEEAIKYGMPCYVLNGNLVFFAAYKNHIALYPAPRQAEEFKEELAEYEGGKGTVQFPLDERIPLGLIKRIVKYLVKKNTEKIKPSHRK